MLTVEGLTKTYPSGDKALNGIDFTVTKGQVIGLIGPSGAGKSTLVRCVNRLVPPSTGRVLLNDLDLTSLNKPGLRRARRRIGMIFQEYALVERLTVMENVLSGRLGYVSFWRSWARRFPGHDIANAFRLLQRVELDGRANSRADALSGGQRQRVGIARALAQEPELLLVDEPTASLDPKTSRTIMRLITDVCREFDLPAVINMHDVVLAQQFSDRIIGLREGSVVFDGRPEELDTDALTQIYGEEDWSAMRKNAAEDADAEREQADRMAGLA